MILQLRRYAYTPEETLGRLSFDGYQLFTVESPWLLNRRFQSCIPDGSYNCRPFQSVKHPDCWQVVDVPDRSGILFHTGNSSADCTGCIIPGLTRTGLNVWNSADAMRLLHDVLDPQAGQFTLEISPALGAILPASEQARNIHAGSPSH